MSFDIFLSYRRSDQGLVEALVPLLEARGLTVWWDNKIQGGDDWRDSIVENLTDSRSLIILFSEECNDSKQLRKELALADHLDKPIIPVLIEDTEPKGHFLYELASRNWLKAHPDPASKLDRLSDSLAAKLGKPATGETPVAPEPEDVAESAPHAPAPEPAAVKPPPAPPFPSRGLGTGNEPAPAPPQPAPSPPISSKTPPQSQSAAQTPPEKARKGSDKLLPFHWIDFIVAPLVLGISFVLGVTESADTTLAGVLGVAVMVLALGGMVVFPIRYYLRESSPYRVGGMLALSNVVLGILFGICMEFDRESYNFIMAVTLGSMLGLVIGLISFSIFALLSAIRARRKFRKRVETV